MVQDNSINQKSNRFANCDWMDDDMKELMQALSQCVVPRSQRRAVVRTNYHAPYYSRSRYSTI